jgi:hypothetical protein
MHSTDLGKIVDAGIPFFSLTAIEVFLVDSDLAEGGGHTNCGGTGNDKVIITDRALGTNPFLLAHEIGHVLSGVHPEEPTVNEQWKGEADTILQPSGSIGKANPAKRPAEYCCKRYNVKLAVSTDVVPAKAYP